ncbi:MAG TPA: hypothetical protein VGQ72_07860 [Pyrinomonadaceae bacterium]|jgi:hypothetical protein|nr:hypothetical protein [Pyrinomonadaceae bacterium]
MAKTELNDWGKADYKRSDLGELVRGKHAKRICESTKTTEKETKASKKKKPRDSQP